MASYGKFGKSNGGEELVVDIVAESAKDMADDDEAFQIPIAAGSKKNDSNGGIGFVNPLASNTSFEAEKSVDLFAPAAAPDNNNGDEKKPSSNGGISSSGGFGNDLFDAIDVEEPRETTVNNNDNDSSPARDFVNPMAAVSSDRVDSAAEAAFTTSDSAFKAKEPFPSSPEATPPHPPPPPHRLDHIEVSLVEDGVEEKEGVLVNATDFFLENNDNYTLSWSEASHKISEVGEDPSRPPLPGWNLPYVRWYLRRIIESLWFRALTMVLIIVDLAVIIMDLATDGGPESNSLTSYQIVDLIITVYFVVEIVLRIFALTHPVFFSTWYNVVDFAVVFITFIVVCVATAGNNWVEALSIFTVVRFVRVFRLVRLYTEKKQIETAARQMVSQNKRRYQQDGYDLDLTYVTPRVIATSGLWSLYRNPIEKVASFLDFKHRDKYRLYNLCSERTYETKHFHGRVERIHIDDHNVPSMSDMRDFAASAKAWLTSDPDNVIVVHCKGGKGRTGTMICVWLVEAGIFTTAGKSLEYFGQRRTDTNVGNKFQGVETPSQSRYVGYFEIMRNKLGGQVPPSTPLVIKQITIRGMMYVGRGNGDDFWFTVHQGRLEQVFSCHVGFRRNLRVEYSPESDVLRLEVLNCPRIDGDIRILFQTSSKTVPKGYEDCPFYFWFNTYFVSEENDLRLVLPRDQLDNPHKSKTWHCFRDTFQVELDFARPST